MYRFVYVCTYSEARKKMPGTPHPGALRTAAKKLSPAVYSKRWASDAGRVGFKQREEVEM